MRYLWYSKSKVGSAVIDLVFEAEAALRAFACRDIPIDHLEGIFGGYVKEAGDIFKPLVTDGYKESI